MTSKDRWLDDVGCDIKRLGTRNWRLKGRSGLEWRAVVGGSRSPI
jgi:hypothetical protein